MVTVSEQLADNKHLATDVPITHEPSLENTDTPLYSATPETTSQLLSRSRFIAHHPKSGINPLADAAAYLFSIIGKLRQIKSWRHLNRLHKELVAEINTFQDTAKSQGYSSEYILVSRYALCATLDDIITNTTWGSQGQWNEYSLLTAFNQESAQQDRFFIILEQIIKDPGLYIDLMEFMYLCLSLGFKGNYRLAEFSSNQLEQICNILYKRIRAHQGDFSKTLSPFPIKPAPIVRPPRPKKKVAIDFIVLSTASIILALFIGLGYLLDTISNQAWQELMHIGKSILYETNNT